MDILKKSLMTLVAATALFLFAACNFELKNDDGKSAPQKEEKQKEEPVKEEPQKEEPVEKVIAATYTNKDAEMFGVEVKIDFYTDGTWLAYDVLLEDGESMAIIDLYKGTFERTASEDGTLKIKATDYSDAAKVIEEENLVSLMTQVKEKMESVGENAKLPVKLDVEWSAYKNPAEETYSVEKGKLTLFDTEFVRLGSENTEVTPPSEDDEEPEVVPPVEKPEEKPETDPVEDTGNKEDEKTLVANYSSKKDPVTGLILTVDFYSDGTWIAYDDIHGVATTEENGVVTQKEEFSAILVDLYKGTYTGKPAEDGKFNIVVTHNTVISNLRGISTIDQYYGEIEKQLSNVGRDAELPVRFTDTWLSSAKVESEVTVSDGKINLFDTDLYKDGKYEEEVEEPVEEPEVKEPELTKEIVARYLGKDDVGDVFIELYDDNSFLAYDIIDFGDGVTMLVDLYKGTYTGNPAVDGHISFNISHRAKILDNDFMSQAPLMEEQLMAAGPNATYPVKFKDEWKEINQAAAVYVKNGKANVLNVDVVREGSSSNPDDAPLFDSKECTVSVDSVVLADGNWTMKIINEVDYIAKGLKTEEKELLLAQFSGTEKETVANLFSGTIIKVPAGKLIQAVTYELVIEDNKVIDLNGAESYSLIIQENELYRRAINYIATNFNNMTYNWDGTTGIFEQKLSKEDLKDMSAMGQYMLDNVLEQDNWKSNSDSSKFWSFDDDMNVYLEKQD